MLQHVGWIKSENGQIFLCNILGVVRCCVCLATFTQHCWTRACVLGPIVACQGPGTHQHPHVALEMLRRLAGSSQMKGHRFDSMRSLFFLYLRPPRPFLETLDGKTSDSSNCFLLGKSRNIQQKTQKENTYNNLVVEKNQRGTNKQILSLWLLRIGHEKPNVHSSFNLHHIYVLLQTKMMRNILRDIWILFQILHLKICRTEKKSRPT